MNPGGIRADLDAGEVTWGDLFAIQPFANDLVSMDLTGSPARAVAQPDLSAATEDVWTHLRVGCIASRRRRVVEIRDADGALLDPGATYRVTVNSFIASGGDNFLVLPSGLNLEVGPVDLDALVEYVSSLAQPFSAQVEGRITRLN